MQYSLNGGSEWQSIYFSQQLVTDYKDLFQLKLGDTGEVPPLLCARVWPNFKLFQIFKNRSIALVCTDLTQHYKLNCDITYQAKLTCKKVKQLKKYTKYTFVLEIFEHHSLCLAITQQFIERRSENANF